MQARLLIAIVGHQLAHAGIRHRTLEEHVAPIGVLQQHIGVGHRHPVEEIARADVIDPFLAGHDADDGRQYAWCS